MAVVCDGHLILLMAARMWLPSTFILNMEHTLYFISQLVKMLPLNEPLTLSYA